MLRRYGDRVAVSQNIDIKPGSSMERVKQSADAFGLEIVLRQMDQSTRTAEDAANACGCTVAQIIKSLVFENAKTGKLVLLLVAGDHQADLQHVADAHGMTLQRCDGRRVRDETGFAIGGVAPIGFKSPIDIYMDVDLTRHDTVWAAAGRPDSVFSVDPNAMAKAIKAQLITVL